MRTRSVSCLLSLAPNPFSDAMEWRRQLRATGRSALARALHTVELDDLGAALPASRHGVADPLDVPEHRVILVLSAVRDSQPLGAHVCARQDGSPAPEPFNSCGCWAVVVVAVATQAPSIMAAMATKIGDCTETARIIHRAPETKKTRSICARQKHEQLGDITSPHWREAGLAPAAERVDRKVQAYCSGIACRR